jgi:hypothetical protein
MTAVLVWCVIVVAVVSTLFFVGVMAAGLIGEVGSAIDWFWNRLTRKSPGQH